MSQTAATYFVDWQRFVTLYQDDPGGHFWERALESLHGEDEGEGAESTERVQNVQVPDWLLENPIEACLVYENFHFWSDFADLYCRMRRDIPSRHLKRFDAFVGAFCPSMSEEVDEMFAPLQDLVGGQEQFYMSVSPETAERYLEIGEGLKLRALKKAFKRNFNRLDDPEEEDEEFEYERDDFANVWSYWIWRIKTNLKLTTDKGSVLADENLTFTDFDDYKSFIVAWTDVLKYAVRNKKGILITVA